MTFPANPAPEPAGEVPPRCHVCEGEGPFNARICRSCQEALGRRLAELLARARFDRAFAREAFAAMDALGKQRFRVLLGDPLQDAAWQPQALRLRERVSGPGLAAARPRPFVQGLVKCPSDESEQATERVSASERRH